MNKETFWVFCLGWLATNTPLIVQLLNALVPVLGLCIAGYAMHITARKGKGRKE